jgi:hypothetical protein
MSTSIICASCGAALSDVPCDEPSKRPLCATCGSTMRNCSVTVGPLHVNLSPFGFQWYAKDFYEAYEKVKGKSTYSPARLTLLAHAIELAAKSLHVHQGKRNADLLKIGHSLTKACDPAVLSLYGITVTAEETSELQKMSDLNEAKALGYFWFRSPHYTPELAGVMHAVTGRPGLPEETVLEGLAVKLLAPQL